MTGFAVGDDRGPESRGLRVGDRVLWTAPLPILHLPALTGRIVTVEPWPYKGYFVIDLDEECSFHDPDGVEHRLRQIRVYGPGLSRIKEGAQRAQQ